MDNWNFPPNIEKKRESRLLRESRKTRKNRTPVWMKWKLMFPLTLTNVRNRMRSGTTSRTFATSRLFRKLRWLIEITIGNFNSITLNNVQITQFFFYSTYMILDVNVCCLVHKQIQCSLKIVFLKECKDGEASDDDSDDDWEDARVAKAKVKLEIYSCQISTQTFVRKIWVTERHLTFANSLFLFQPGFSLPVQLAWQASSHGCSRQGSQDR